jgi:hypothetical protein
MKAVAAATVPSHSSVSFTCVCLPCAYTASCKFTATYSGACIHGESHRLYVR